MVTASSKLLQIIIKFYVRGCASRKKLFSIIFDEEHGQPHKLNQMKKYFVE